MFDVLRKIYAMLSPQRQKQLIWLAVGMFTLAFVELGLAGTISLLGVALAAPEGLEKIGPLWKIFQMLPPFGEGIPQGIRMLILVLGLVCVATVLKNILTAGMTYWQGVMSQIVGWDICEQVFDTYLYAPYVWHTQHNAADLSVHLTWRLYISNFFLGGLQVASQTGIMLFLMLGAFIMAPLESLLLYGVAACVALLVYKAAQRKALEAGEQAAELGVDVGRVALSALHGIREVQIYGQQGAFANHFASYANPIARATARQNLFPAMPLWFLETTGMTLLFLAVILMAARNQSVASITGTLTLMAAVCWRMLPALNKIVSGVLLLKTSFSPVQSLIVNNTDSLRINVHATHTPFERSLELRDVSFRYPHAQDDSLANINLTINKGDMVGLIGLSGAGKSTVVGLLTGLLEPRKGLLLVDGKEVKPAPEFLKIGYVPQNPYIIDASLAENVAFSTWGSAPDEDRVRECCRMAAMDFLDSLPEGIHTELGDRGVRLSGGQVQRIAIARALYGAPDILLLDEATSALDGAAESAIQSTIQNLRENLTIVVVAHRLSTVQGCDQLYWLDGGEVRRFGSPDEVLNEYQVYLRAFGEDR